MIVKNSGDGKSFGPRAEYLTHDKDARTDERVDWTKTHNLANENVHAAIDEMQLTAENAELLKQEAGVRGGGRRAEKISKHYSLNWAISDSPSQEHMIETCRDFLRHMGWHEHQAVFIAHNDKPYKHVHILINAVHPETGLRLNDDFEHERAQAWALQYELSQNHVHCTERLKNANEREKNMPRNIWMSFQPYEQEFLKSEQHWQQNVEVPEYQPKNRKSAEWEIFKEIQRDERDQFYADGKREFKALRASIYREVREEFRERWGDYYKAKKLGRKEDQHSLEKVKSEIIADQKAALEPRRDAACAELLQAREIKRQELRERQTKERAEFRGRLELGIDNSDFFHHLTTGRERREEIGLGFREAASEVTRSTTVEQTRSSEWAEVEHDSRRRLSRVGLLQAAEFGPRKAARAAGALVDGVFSFLTNLGSAPPEPISSQERADQFREAAENALKQEQHRGREEEDAGWRERQRAISRE
ncbi:relaxase/mobilization nuclease domain-containing protein [Bradyrhizobium iriomotense]|uniref:MobA/VirD2-like nuclease domain-containing protein n=1 Tax=Bradyrhizobium iriomotense TaxID=441950 RepID=A0ABQ6AZA9_9BRAD|nr:relaxase/mobilization nuclease domain-containing protein [Bradyrhizobium iriomotense]GLR86536.1 hypothetical protein GCM10007857_32470 [Bradyrhizobium iriomotense]